MTRPRPRRRARPHARSTTAVAVPWGRWGGKRGVTPKKRKMLLGRDWGRCWRRSCHRPRLPGKPWIGRSRSRPSSGTGKRARSSIPSLARDPGHPLGRVLDGVLRAHEGRIGEAIEIFERLRRDHPRSNGRRGNNLAVLYAAEGRFDEGPGDPPHHACAPALAIGYANLGDIHSTLARHAYARARELGPDVGGGSATAEESRLGLAISAVPAAAAARADSSARGAGAGHGAARSSDPFARATRRVPSSRGARRPQGPLRRAGVARVGGSRRWSSCVG